MSLTNIRNFALVAVLGFLVSACATGGKKRTSNDWYTGTDTVKFLAAGVIDRVFFATNRWRDFLMSQGVSGSKITVISYGKERPVNPESSRLAWSQNRRAVTVKAK